MLKPLDNPNIPADIQNLSLANIPSDNTGGMVTDVTCGDLGTPPCDDDPDKSKSENQLIVQESSNGDILTITLSNLGTMLFVGLMMGSLVLLASADLSSSSLSLIHI